MHYRKSHKFQIVTVETHDIQSKGDHQHNIFQEVYTLNPPQVLLSVGSFCCTVEFVSIGYMKASAD